jgi:hypothetical protein
MNFEFKGLTGALLEKSDPGSSTAAYSVLDIFTALPGKSGMGNDAGIVSIQYSFLFFTLAMPVIFTVMLFGMWCFPLPTGFRTSLFTLLEIAQAWSALEVFAIAIAASLLEIQQFATFIIGSNCDKINAFLEENAGQRLGGDDTCFDVIATLRTPAWTLLLSVVCLLFFCLPLTRLIGCCIEPEDESEDEYDASELSVQDQIKFADDTSTLEEPLLEGSLRKRRHSLTLGERFVKYGVILHLITEDGDGKLKDEGGSLDFSIARG